MITLTSVAAAPLSLRIMWPLPVSMGRGGEGSDEVRLWDWRAGKVVRRIRTAAVSLAFSPDGAHLAAAAPAGPPAIWSVRSGREAGRLTGHTGAVTAVAYSPDGSHLASASADGTVRLWDPATRRQTLVLRGQRLTAECRQYLRGRDCG
jgi:WD40 repeat protein